MEKGWVKIASFTKELNAEMIKLLLEQQGIMAVLLNKQDSSLKFGGIELFVSEQDVEAAMEFIDVEGSELTDEN